jgi:hypothetical protein
VTAADLCFANVPQSVGSLRQDDNVRDFAGGLACVELAGRENVVILLIKVPAYPSRQVLAGSLWQQWNCDICDIFSP